MQVRARNRTKGLRLLGPQAARNMKALLDSDVIDGGPVAVFLQRLRDLMEGGFAISVGDESRREAVQVMT